MMTTAEAALISGLGGLVVAAALILLGGVWFFIPYIAHIEKVPADVSYFNIRVASRLIGAGLILILLSFAFVYVRELLTRVV